MDFNFRGGPPAPESPPPPATEPLPAATPPITRPIEPRPRLPRSDPEFDGRSALGGLARATRPVARPATPPSATPSTAQFVRPASKAQRRLPVPPASGSETTLQTPFSAADSGRKPDKVGNASSEAGQASGQYSPASSGSEEPTPEPQPGSGNDRGGDLPPPERPGSRPLGGGEDPEGGGEHEPSREAGLPDPRDPSGEPGFGGQGTPHSHLGRTAWQASRASSNFSGDSTGSFLPPQFVDENQAWELFQASHERNFDQLVARRVEGVEALDRELRAVVPQVHETLQEGMQAAIDAGYVPTTALERLEPAFAQTAIRAVDQAVLGEGDIAVYDQASDTMTVGTDAIEYDDNLEQTVAHEIGGHKISGGTFVTREDGTVARVRRGFVNHDEEASSLASARHYGLDEAVQQHLSLSYMHGEIDVIDPDARTDGDESYYEHRKLLSEFIDRSGDVIDPKAITRGSFEDSDEAGAVTTDRRAMVMQARTAYGPGAYHKLSQLFDKIVYDNMSAGELAERIHSPEFNPDGSVKRPGYIDTEDDSEDFSLPVYS
jgi:hypothetical protein